MESSGVSVLFARKDSVYKSIDGCDVWDKSRDARNFCGLNPVVAHPPCRGWGRLKAFARPEPGEKELAFFAIDMIRRNGGVLEHPAWSSLWKEAGLPLPGQKSAAGEFTFSAPQYWWGHRAEKNTWFFISGLRQKDLPEIPFVLGEAEYVVSGSRASKRERRPEIKKSEREHTPVDLAIWLCEVARRCK